MSEQTAAESHPGPGELRLRPMSAAELPGYVGHLEREYAREIHESTGVDAETAAEQSRRSTAESFPGGAVAAGHHLWVAVDAAGDRVGVLWLARREVGTATEHVWIYDIEVDEGRRGAGWGRRLLTLAEAETRALGSTSLRLNVFGENRVARALYHSQGFTESRITMIKDVGPSSAG